MTALTHEPTPLTDLPPVTAWLSDMDGVLVKENRALPGANEFLAALSEKNIPFLVLTNNSVFTNRDLSARLANSGLDIPEDNIWTSANATAAFLHQQSPGSTAYVIGEAGLTTAIHTAGSVMTEIDPEFVVLGEVRSYNQYAKRNDKSRQIPEHAQHITFRQIVLTYMWVYCSIRDAVNPIRYFEYQPGRSGKYPEAFLRNMKVISIQTLTPDTMQFQE